MPDGSPKAAHANVAMYKQQPAPAVGKAPVTLLEETPPLGLSMQRAVVDPGGLRPADVLALQHVAGNRVVSRLIQAKLTIGPANDRYEQEADRVAEQVVGGQESAANSKRPCVQRAAAPEEEEVQTKPSRNLDRGLGLAASITNAQRLDEIQRVPLFGTSAIDYDAAHNTLTFNTVNKAITAADHLTLMNAITTMTGLHADPVSILSLIHI